MSFHYACLARMPGVSAELKRNPSDFRVEEELGFELDGQGEHVYLYIEKSGLNTTDIVTRLRRFAACRERDIGYSGLKDRHAVTRQWFSIHMTGSREPDWHGIDNGQVKCLEVARHGRKLRRGSHRRNGFSIILRDLVGDAAEVEQRLQQVRQQGVPNYFGEQRFGTRYANIERAEKMLRGEIPLKNNTKRGLYLSALRSMLFNKVLSERVANASWCRALPGELLVLDGSSSFFQAQADDSDLTSRIASGDVHPSGPLWGKLKPGKFDLGHDVFKMEQRIMSMHGFWCEGLEQAGMKYERRALRLPVTGLQWQFSGRNLELTFSLPRGTFATSVLRELVNYETNRGQTP